MDLSDFLKACRCHTADFSTHAVLPRRQAAVYAFYEAFKLRGKKPADEIDNFATKRARSITLDLKTLPESLTIKMRGTSERFKGEGLKHVNNVRKADRDLFCNTLHFLSIISEPSYVGETKDVKTRFRAHHDSGFLKRMKDAGRPPEEFVFFFFETTNNTHQALETVLIHLISPSGNKIGSLIDKKK